MILLCLSLIKNLMMNTCAVVEIYRHYFLISALISNRYLHVLTALSSEETASVTHFVRHLVAPELFRSTVAKNILYGCETWSLTLREERRLRVFENRVLRRIFGPKRDEVTEGGT
jgi:hypothetical protein